VIPADPGAPAFRQGDTLGEARKHWFRAKCFQQYRLFYRFSSEAGIIVLAWVNDETTLRVSSPSDRAATGAARRARLSGPTRGGVSDKGDRGRGTRSRSAQRLRGSQGDAARRCRIEGLGSRYPELPVMDGGDHGWVDPAPVFGWWVGGRAHFASARKTSRSSCMISSANAICRANSGL